MIDLADITARMQCKAVCDPHMTLFDGRRWEGQWAGEYIMYRNNAEDTEVTCNALMLRINRHGIMLCAQVSHW